MLTVSTCCHFFKPVLITGKGCFHPWLSISWIYHFIRWKVWMLKQQSFQLLIDSGKRLISLGTSSRYIHKYYRVAHFVKVYSRHRSVNPYGWRIFGGDGQFHHLLNKLLLFLGKLAEINPRRRICYVAPNHPFRLVQFSRSCCVFRKALSTALHIIHQRLPTKTKWEQFSSLATSRFHSGTFIWNQLWSRFGRSSSTIIWWSMSHDISRNFCFG